MAPVERLATLVYMLPFRDNLLMLFTFYLMCPVHFKVN